MFWIFSKKWREARRVREWNTNRLIYEFFDGTAFVTADPLVIERKLESDPECRWDVHPRLAESGDQEAVGILVRAARRAFNVPALEQGGLTEVETLNLMSDFYEWLETLKKNSPDSLMPQESTELISAGTGETTIPLSSG